MRHSALPRRVLLAGLLLPAPAGAATVEIIIDEFEFRPAELRVPPGTRVRWVNRDGSPHNVVSDAEPRLFRSRLMETGDSYAFTFDGAGEHGYYCALHPHMTGRVVVE